MPRPKPKKRPFLPAWIILIAPMLGRINETFLISEIEGEDLPNRRRKMDYLKDIDRDDGEF